MTFPVCGADGFSHTYFFCCSFTLMIPRIYNDLIECAKPWLYFNWLRFNDTLTFFPNESNGKARFFGRRGKQMSLYWCNDIGREIWIQLTNNNSAVKNVPIHRNKWECRIDKLNFQRQPTAKKTEIERNRQEMKRCKYLAWRKLDDASYQFFFISMCKCYWIVCFEYLFDVLMWKELIFCCGDDAYADARLKIYGLTSEKEVNVESKPKFYFQWISPILGINHSFMHIQISRQINKIQIE